MKHRQVIIVLLIVFLHGHPSVVFAERPGPTPTPKLVDYTLPYPGLLPDHPLYFFRSMRDTMQDILLSSPIKKAKFHLLQADKRMSASILLSDRKDTLQLSAATAMESQEHFERALESLVNAKKQGLEVSEIAKKLVVANAKHIELLTQMEKNAVEYKEEFAKALEQAQDLRTRVRVFASNI